MDTSRHQRVRLSFYSYRHIVSLRKGVGGEGESHHHQVGPIFTGLFFGGDGRGEGEGGEGMRKKEEWKEWEEEEEEEWGGGGEEGKGWRGCGVRNVPRKETVWRDCSRRIPWPEGKDIQKVRNSISVLQAAKRSRGNYLSVRLGRGSWVTRVVVVGLVVHGRDVWRVKTSF